MVPVGLALLHWSNRVSAMVPEHGDLFQHLFGGAVLAFHRIVDWSSGIFLRAGGESENLMTLENLLNGRFWLNNILI